MTVTWVVAFSPLLGVRSVEVQGVQTVPVAQVRQAADVADGTPLVRVDTEAIAARVERIKAVASARVTTSFPSTVVISVTERVAVGVVPFGSRYRLVDRTGAQFRTLSKAPARLPRFVVPSGQQARRTGAAVATVAAALPPELRARVASVQALDPSAITLLLTDKRVVRWGNAADSADKARILTLLLREPGDQFDVTDPSRPFSR